MPALRRGGVSPLLASNSAISGPRSGWRGTRMHKRSGCMARKASWHAPIMASSPGCVLAATQTGRFCSAACIWARADASASRGGASSFRFPADTISCSPNSCQRCAVMSSCASSRSKQPNSARAEFFARRQNLNDFSESRPLTNTAGILRRRISSSRFGHNSLSTNSASCGDQWSKKRFTQRARSSGKY